MEWILKMQKCHRRGVDHPANDNGKEFSFACEEAREASPTP